MRGRARVCTRVQADAEPHVALVRRSLEHSRRRAVEKEAWRGGDRRSVSSHLCALGRQEGSEPASAPGTSVEVRPVRLGGLGVTVPARLHQEHPGPLPPLPPSQQTQWTGQRPPQLSSWPPRWPQRPRWAGTLFKWKSAAPLPGLGPGEAPPVRRQCQLLSGHADPALLLRPAPGP